MSAGLAGAVSDQRMKGQANSQVSNGPKEHRQQQQQAEHGSAEDTGFDSWRGGNSTPHHSSYPIGTGDPYSPYYAGTSFPYQAFGAGDGTWSNGTDPVTFLSGYGGQMNPDVYGMDGIFSASPGGGFSAFGQPAFNYFHGNGDFNAWGTPRKTRYEDYYQQQARGSENYQSSGGGELKTIEQSVQGLSISGEVPRQDQSIPTSQPKPEPKEPRKITWASVASQPAKPVPPISSTQGMKKKAGMPPPPIVPGKHNMDIGTWGEGKSSIPPPKAPPPPQVQPSLPSPQPPVQRQRPHHSITPVWNRQPTTPPPQPQSQIQMPSQHQHQPQPPPQHQHQQQHHQSPPSQQQQHRQQHPQHQQQQSLQSPPQQQVTASVLPHPVLNELKVKNEYNPVDLEETAPGARFFVIKSYSEDDIHRSIKYEIWCSTEHGNKRLDLAFREASRDGAPLYLFFSVNGSGHFCGMAQMVSSVDYQSNSSVWSQDKWKGQFRVHWIYVKDVPNVQLRHIRLENNENKPVTNSRDAQEVPHAKGVHVLRILHTYRHSTSIFDDFGHYERRQAEEDQRKVPVNPMPHHHPPPNHRNRGRSSDLTREHHQYQQHGHPPHPHPRDQRDQRDQRDHRGQRDERDQHDQRKERDSRGRGRGGSRQ